MGRILRLPEDVANQIAAGEVVERPASVAKELVENALDAGATRIVVEIEGGGSELIRITDDGIGMTREDAVLCLERHATSKLTCADDLVSVATLGFRGEAIPSIASVSRFTLTTCARGEDEGTRVTVQGGRDTQVMSAGVPVGTVVEARELFFNVPARRKFLKRPATETSHLGDAVARLAMSRPDVAFELVVDGRVQLDAPQQAPGDPRARLGRILGRDVGPKLHPILDDGIAHRVGVRGFVSSPELSERTMRGLYTFVNGRFVRDRTIQHAVQDAYRTLLEKGRYPVVVLFLDVAPETLDVNVHPQKTEVRFERTGDIHAAISGALGRTLAAQPWLGSAAPGPAPTRTYAIGAGFDEHESRVRDAMSALGRGQEKSTGRWMGGAAPVSPARGSTSVAPARPWAPASLFDRGAPQEGLPTEESEAPRTADRGFQPPAPRGPSPGPLRFASLSPVGQVLGTYLVCQAPGRMVVIDQHAAHERIAFERMRKQRRAEKVLVQPLLVPVTIELDASRSAVLHDERERLAELGIEVEPFGGQTWVVKSCPTALGSARIEALLLDLIDELKEFGEATPLEERIEALFSCAACHTVVRAGDRLGREEISALLEQMDEIDFGAHCPHGRPVFVEWSEEHLARLFHRR